MNVVAHCHASNTLWDCLSSVSLLTLIPKLVQTAPQGPKPQTHANLHATAMLLYNPLQLAEQQTASPSANAMGSIRYFNELLPSLVLVSLVPPPQIRAPKSSRSYPSGRLAACRHLVHTKTSAAVLSQPKRIRYAVAAAEYSSTASRLLARLRSISSPFTASTFSTRKTNMDTRLQDVLGFCIHRRLPRQAQQEQETQADRPAIS